MELTNHKEAKSYLGSGYGRAKATLLSGRRMDRYSPAELSLKLVWRGPAGSLRFFPVAVQARW
jgi:hypothetical protein